MKITEKDLESYFPRDNRFLHFCAKYYNMSFFSDEVVEEASYQALENVMRLYNNGKEFVDEKEKTGIVMSSFRFGILSAYGKMERRNRLDCKNESQMTYGDGSEEYNKFLSEAISSDKEYNNFMILLNKFIEHNLTPLERESVTGLILGDKTYQMVANEFEVGINPVRAAKQRAITKLRKYVNRLTRFEELEETQDDRQRYVSDSVSKLRIQILLESARKDEEERNRYLKALSYVHLDE